MYKFRKFDYDQFNSLPAGYNDIFLYGFFVSDYSAITGIGIGTIMGAIFIFMMGVFFVATEEMLEKTDKGTRVV